MATGYDHDESDERDDAPRPGDESPDRPSKTRRKKAMHALQALGERLVGLPESRLRKVPLDDDLRTAIDQARGIRSHEGRRRQLQYVGKLMRTADAAAIEASLAGDDADHARQVAVHHAAEQWRDGLVDGSRRIEDFLARFPPARTPLHDTAADGPADDPASPGSAGAPALARDELARLAAAARQAGAAGGSSPNPKHARALYRALHQWLIASEGLDR